MRHAALLLAAALLAAPAASAQPVTYGPQLEGFDYPHPVSRFEFESQKAALSMAYMDIRPARPNGRVIVLMHGKNFCGATWEDAITALSAAGWRVIAPDQIGFCKSTKPAAYQYSLHQLAANTHALLSSLGIERAVIAGHSMGGMLAARYALTYPDAVEGLALVNPIGLEDWENEGVPHQTVDQWLAAEQTSTRDSMKAYQLGTYYAGQWQPRYDRWVDMQAGLYAGPGRDQVLWSQALASDMIFTQPVVQDFPSIKAPTVLFIGEKDNTAIGKAAAPPDIRGRLGNYPELGKRAAQAIPDANLVAFPDLGHSPQIQDPARFNSALLKALDAFPRR
jgi:pimeloyl-ACP methyl ester carboxylesterase